MPPSTPERKVLVAIIDDHAPFRSSTCRLLERRGFETCAYGSVVDFLSSGAMRRIDCLLLDIGLPDIDGLAFKECLSNTNYRFPVILCTGMEIDPAKSDGLAYGASAVLQKPVHADTLVDTIRFACVPK